MIDSWGTVPCSTMSLLETEETEFEVQGVTRRGETSQGMVFDDCQFVSASQGD